MYFTVYKITNKINGKEYIGAHKTSDLDDGYMGSGKHLVNSQKKYGLENFSKEIIFRAVSSEAMYFIERMLVDEEYVARDDTYNLKLGGSGGFDYINSSGIGKEAAIKGGKIGRVKIKELSKDVNWVQHRSENISNGLKKAYENGTKVVTQNIFLNSLRNSNKRWVKNSELNLRKRIEKEDVENFLKNNNGWTKGKNFN